MLVMSGNVQDFSSSHELSISVTAKEKSSRKKPDGLSMQLGLRSCGKVAAHASAVRGNVRGFCDADRNR